MRPRRARSHDARRSDARAAAGCIAGVAALVVVLAASAAFNQSRDRTRRGRAGGDAATKPSVAVLYFENNTGNPQLDWLRTGLTDMIVTDLSQSPDVEVLGTDRLVQILDDMKRQDDRADLVRHRAGDREARRRQERDPRQLRQGRRHDPHQRQAAGRGDRPDPHVGARRGGRANRTCSRPSTISRGGSRAKFAAAAAPIRPGRCSVAQPTTTTTTAAVDRSRSEGRHARPRSTRIATTPKGIDLHEREQGGGSRAAAREGGRRSIRVSRWRWQARRASRATWRTPPSATSTRSARSSTSIGSPPRERYYIEGVYYSNKR